MYDARAIRCLALLWLSVLPVVTLAHHALLSYDHGEIVRFEGEVTDFFWRNPHVRLTVRDVDEDGERIWTVEGASVNAMERAGINQAIVEVGDRIGLVGHPSSMEENLVQPVVVTLANGSSIVLNVRSATEFGLIDDASRVAAAGDGYAEIAADDLDVDGIFRVWTNTGHWGRDVRGWWARDFPLNESARPAYEAWNPQTDDLAAQCLPAGLPEAMMQPFPIEFVDRGDTVILNIEEWDNSRTIHLNADPEAEVSYSRLGYSVGRWEDDRTLVVETSRINYPYFNDRGIPQSEAVEIVERFTLSEDETRLDWAATLTDPGTFTEPITMAELHWEWIPGNTIKPYNCVVDDN